MCYANRVSCSSTATHLGFLLTMRHLLFFTRMGFSSIVAPGEKDLEMPLVLLWLLCLPDVDRSQPLSESSLRDYIDSVLEDNSHLVSVSF